MDARKALPSLILLFILVEETVLFTFFGFGCIAGNQTWDLVHARQVHYHLALFLALAVHFRHIPFRKVMWRGEKTAGWPIRSSLWWGERTPEGRARIVLSYSLEVGPGESPPPLWAWVSTTHGIISVVVWIWHVSHRPMCLSTWLPAGAAAWEGCDVFKSQSLPRRNESPGMSLDIPALLSSLPDWECN